MRKPCKTDLKHHTTFAEILSRLVLPMPMCCSCRQIKCLHVLYYHVVLSAGISAKTIFDSSLHLFSRGFMFYLSYLNIFTCTYSGVQHDFRIYAFLAVNMMGVTNGAGTDNPCKWSPYISIFIKLCIDL